MGIFSFLKKKPPEPVATVQATATTRSVPWEEIKAERSGVVPVINNNVGTPEPNKYGNYLYPPLALFTVYGTNPKTDRKNKRTFEAKSSIEAELQAMDAGLVPPFETSWEPLAGPSERQMEYATDIGLTIPEGACMTDASALLTRYEDNDTETASPGFLEYLAAKGWQGSSLCGYKRALRIAIEGNIIESLDEWEKVALYAYCAVKGARGEPVENLLTAPERDMCFGFSEKVFADGKLLASFRRQTFRDYYQPEKRSAIYQATKKLF